ncbi:MAG: glycosyl transferase, partial [Sinomonas sp.]|nr:glycosyl transferase [Sinomonas sp.]
TTAALGGAAALAGPFAFPLQTVATAHSGAIVTAGPSSGFGRGGFAGLGGQRNGQALGFPGTGTTQGLAPGGAGQAGAAQGQGGFGGGRGGIGGLLGATTPSSALVTALQTDASKYTWAAAVVGSNNAAGYQLATQLPVMAIGGFNGTDPAPTLAQFKQLVKEGKIHYFVAGSLMQGNSGLDEAQQIAAWVEANFQAQTVGGTTVYALGN